MTAAGRTPFLREVVAYRPFLHSRLLLLLSLTVLATPLLLTALYVRAGLGNLLALLIHFQERILPLWVLVAAVLIWADLDPAHRPIALAWPVKRWRLVASRTAVVLVLYLLLVLLWTWGLPRLYVQATGVPVSALVQGDLAPETLFSRALAVGLFYMGVVSAAGSAGRRWVGLTVAGAIGLLSSMGSLLDGVAGGSLYLCAWSGKSVRNLTYVTAGNVLVGCAGLLLSLGLLQSGGWTGIGRWARRICCQTTRQLSLLKSPAVLLSALAVFAVPVMLLLWFQRGWVDSGDLVRGFLEWHERFLPLLVVAAAGSLWSDLTRRCWVIPAVWPASGGLWVATKVLAAAVFYIPLAAAAAWLTPAILKATLGVESAVLPGGLLLLRSLVPGAMLLGLVSLGGAVGSVAGGVALGGLLWVTNLLDRGWLPAFLGGALDLFAWSRAPQLFPWSATRWMLLAAAVLLAGAAAVYDIRSHRFALRVGGRQ